jgi:aldose 1-epimerase
VVSVTADARSAHATSRLEFWKHPALMAQFPFAHTITMTYRLADGVLEVETLLENHSSDPMPVGIGYHPYFQLPDVPRDEWSVHLAAREQMTLSDALIPTGERKPLTEPDRGLRGTQLDDVFTKLIRAADGRAHFVVQGGGRKITVSYGPQFPVAVVYAPAGRQFVCFEPMAAITNAFNLAHARVYKELQSVPAGGQWKESFCVAPSGF